MDPGPVLFSLAILLLFAPAIMVVYVLVTDDPNRGGASALPSDYRPEANHPRPGTAPGECSRCGAENDPRFAYCRECGSELEDREFTETASSEELFDAE